MGNSGTPQKDLHHRSVSSLQLAASQARFSFFGGDGSPILFKTHTYYSCENGGSQKVSLRIQNAEGPRSSTKAKSNLLGYQDVHFPWTKKKQLPVHLKEPYMHRTAQSNGALPRTEMKIPALGTKIIGKKSPKGLADSREAKAEIHPTPFGPV